MVAKKSKTMELYQLVADIDLEELLSSIGIDEDSIHNYNETTLLFYQGQTPIVAYLLLSGNIYLKKNKKIKECLGPGTLLGLNELIYHGTSPYEAHISKDANVILINKTTAKNLINYDHRQFSDLFKKCAN